MAEERFYGYRKPLKGRLQVPGDKSISHRAAIFGAVAHGTTTIRGFLRGDDCLSTLSCMRALGADVTDDGDLITIRGTGFEGLKEPESVLNVGNSGTTIRLLCGLLAARPFFSVLIGDASIHRRPMDRVLLPLKKMGADIWGRADDRYAPIAIKGRTLEPAVYQLPVASAQVKSALLLAGLQAKGKTVLTEPGASRDHTERMIRAFGGRIESEGQAHTLIGPQSLKGTDIRVPGDFSSAAFFIVAALITPGSKLCLTSVGINPTRIGMVDLLRQMGADISFTNEQDWNGEPAADIVVRYAPLKAATVGGALIPKLIDEIPIIALLATQAEGKTIIKDAAELKVKETNRIKTTVNELKRIGADIEETDDGMIIYGHPDQPFSGGSADSCGDHRIGMMLAIASQKAREAITVSHSEAISVSFPSFSELLQTAQNELN